MIQISKRANFRRRTIATGCSNKVLPRACSSNSNNHNKECNSNKLAKTAGLLPRSLNRVALKAAPAALLVMPRQLCGKQKYTPLPLPHLYSMLSIHSLDLTYSLPLSPSLPPCHRCITLRRHTLLIVDLDFQRSHPPDFSCSFH
jgi:hypothetical protein